MITIDCTLKTRKDLRQLTPLELKIADCLMECYYENDGKSGAAVGVVLLRAQQKGYLSRVPTKAQFESEFILK